MKARYNNGLRNLALLSLFITSYIPLFAIVVLKQVNDGWTYLHWGGFNCEAIGCFLKSFWMSAVLLCLSVFGVVGTILLFRNLKTNLPNGSAVKVTKINNRNSEAIGYIATYIVPFFASDFSSWVECVVFVVIMTLIYTIYTNSSMILINPLLSIWYSLLEIEYTIVGDSSEGTHDALIITNTKDFKENINYQIYQIGFKLYYGKEKQ